MGQDFTSIIYKEWMKANKMEFVIIRPDRYVFDAGKLKDLGMVLNTFFGMLS